LSLATIVSDPPTSMLVLLAMLWVAAKVGAELAVRFKIPTVAGQLLMGVILAAISEFFPRFPNVIESYEANVLAYIGIVVLMFVVGLESSVAQVISVGWTSFRVAFVGVIAPTILGIAGSYLILPDAAFAEHLFIGACLSVTSTSITMQVMREKGVSKSRSGRIIVGAAIIDDILGLLLLAAVSGIAVATAVDFATTTAATGGSLWRELGKVLGMTTLFIAFALAVGYWVSPKLFKLASRFRSEELLLPLALAFAFLMAYVGTFVGLAAIVGACAAGLVLEHSHVLLLQERETHTLEEMLHPLVMTFAPFFFVLTGARIEIRALMQPSTLILIIVLTIAGIVGKYLCSYVVGRGLNSPIIGWGMVPRGEVGLIFVAVGRDIKINGVSFLSPEIQAGVLGAILLATIVGPIGLGRAMDKANGQV